MLHINRKAISDSANIFNIVLPLRTQLLPECSDVRFNGGIQIDLAVVLPNMMVKLLFGKNLFPMACQTVEQRKFFVCKFYLLSVQGHTPVGRINDQLGTKSKRIVLIL